jgi:hypothetical protein
MAFGDRKLTAFNTKAKKPMKRSSIKAKTPLRGSTRPKVKSKTPTGKMTARSKKMALKKKLCEQYNLPLLPCSRWGTAKTFTRTDLLRGMAWHIFSKHIRERDLGEPCITCSQPLQMGGIQAGHYIPVGGNSIVTHFLEDNVNGECPTCNGDFNGWHLVPMRKNMVIRYGEERVEELDKLAGLKDSIKFSEEYFVNLIKRYI